MEMAAALAHALLILPCDDNGRTTDETEPHRRQWDAHDLAFHAQSRLGRSGVQVGATWSYRGEIPEPPAIRDNPWGGAAIPLYRPAALSRDLSLFEAMETRRSIRQYSAYPLTAAELGEFLFRTMRIRSRMPMPDGSEYVSRPYPNGGGSTSRSSTSQSMPAPISCAGSITTTHCSMRFVRWPVPVRRWRR